MKSANKSCFRCELFRTAASGFRLQTGSEPDSKEILYLLFSSISR